MVRNQMSIAMHDCQSPSDLCGYNLDMICTEQG